MTEPVVTLSAIGPDGKIWEVHVCPKCRMTAPSKHIAEKCCEPRLCECGAEVSRYFTMCDACREKKEQDRERTLFDKAEKISYRDYDGPVFDGVDRFHGSISDMMDYYEDDELPLPGHVWACTQLGLSMDATDIVNGALEAQDHHEDAFDQIGDAELRELQQYLDKWCADTGVESWFPNYKLAVLLDGMGTKP